MGEENTKGREGREGRGGRKAGEGGNEVKSREGRRKTEQEIEGMDSRMSRVGGME